MADFYSTQCASTRVTIVCAVCGCEFKVKPSRAATAVVCSIRCRTMRLRVPYAEAFWRHVQKAGPSECWLWTGTKNRKGYGMFGSFGESKLAHRVAWELTKGPIPKGLLGCHRCDVPACCNPDHLFLGTNKENGLDAAAKGRLPRGSASALSKLTEAQVSEARVLRKNGTSVREIAAMYGVAIPTIKDVISRKQWKHVA